MPTLRSYHSPSLINVNNVFIEPFRDQNVYALSRSIPAAMPGTPNLIVDQRVHLSYDQLRQAIQESSNGLTHTQLQGQLLSEVRTCRKQIASPLDPQADREPNAGDRARFAGREEVVISLPSDSIIIPNGGETNGAAEQQQELQQSEIRLGPDLIAVALALSDELHLNEIDTAVLLSHARTRAAMRPDRDVVAAAKELSSVRRRQSVLYLQEILRAGLLTPHSAPATADDSFVSALVRERDILIAEHGVFNSIAQRLRMAWSVLNNQAQAQSSNLTASDQQQLLLHQAQQPTSQQLLLPSSSSTPDPLTPEQRRAQLHPGETQLLAETLFLIAYTVQLTKDEAILLRELVTEAEQVHSSLLRRERAATRPSSRGFGVTFDLPTDTTPSFEMSSPALVEAEGVRNLTVLAWLCALDRSRYHDTYNPHTGRSDVNMLLRDTTFLPHTMNVPKLESEETEQDPVRLFPKPIAAAELCGAIFRLAVANPDEHECVATFVRLSAFSDALPFLADELSSWIDKGAGSLSPDADLYADVLEDLAADISEAPHVLTPLLQYVMNDVQDRAANTVYIPPESLNYGMMPSTPAQTAPSSSRRNRPASISVTPTPSTTSGRRASLSVTPHGRPPRPPSGRPSARPSSMRMPSDGGRASNFGAFGTSPTMGREGLVPDDTGEPQDKKTAFESVLSTLCRFVARAIGLAPSKLSSQVANGGLRYWSSLGPANWGLVQRIGDAVMDLWDLAMRNPYAPGGVGQAFQQALNGYLELMASTCKKHDSPLHAFAALRFLAEGGHSVVSLDQLLRGLSSTNAQLGSIVNDQERQMDDIDCDVLGGMLNVIANAADALQDHGGIMSALGERGKELAAHIGALAVHNVPTTFKEVLLRSLRALGEQKPIVTFLENVAKDKAAPLRHYLRNTDAQSGDFRVTIRMLELAIFSTTWVQEEFPEMAVESITTWFAIEEVLMYWTRRKYAHEAHRWEVVHVAGTLIREVVYKNLSSTRSHRILAHLLTPAPGTGAASFSLRTLVCATGLVRTGQESTNSLATDPLLGNLFRVSGRASLAAAVDHGLGDAYRMMQEAVRTSARIISLLLEVSPGRMSVPGISIVSAAELLNGELASLSAATSMVFNPDDFIPQILRAGYSSVVCGSVLAMLSRAARESENIAALFGKDVGGSDAHAAEFRTSLAYIISRCDPSVETSSARDSQSGGGEAKFSIESTDFPDPPLMHAALALVEACLGQDGSNQPGTFLLGLRMNTTNRYESAHYGVLGALVELVANPSNGDDRIDSMSRATAATFLERLSANTVRSTSLAVLEHLKDVCAGNDAVRGGGFADEMLFRVMDVFRMFEPKAMANEINWTALGGLVSACLSLSALQVRLFPEHERELTLSNQSRPVTSLPSPLDLLRVLDSMANSGGELQVVSEAFRNWYLLLGTRLGVHEANDGYCQVPLLFEVTSVVLEGLSQPGSGRNLSGVFKKDGGEIAGTTILVCIDRMRACDSVNSSLGEEFVSDMQCGSLLSGIIRSLAEVTGIGSNAARGRTSLYSALLICGQIAEKRVSDDIIGRAFSRRVGQRSGTEVVISAACGDAIGGASASTKCSGLAAVCMMTHMDAAHAVAALEVQGRFRKVVQVCLADEKVRFMISEACWGGLDEGANPGVGGRAHVAALQAVVAVADAIVGVIHAVAASGHGIRLIAECGCVEAIAMLLPNVFYRGGVVGSVSGRIDTNSQATRKVGRGRPSIGDFDGPHYGRESESFGTGDVAMGGVSGSRGVSGKAEDESGDQRRSMLASFTGALAAAISCAGSAVDYGSAFAIGEGRNVLIEVLKNIQLPGCIELETISNIGLMMSRLVDEVVMGSEGGSQICGWLATVLSVVTPATDVSMQIGDSGSGLSVGAAVLEPDSASEARRMRILHPEGGSLYERDLMKARVSCTQSIFAALRSVQRSIHLFVPEVEDGDGLGLDSGIATPGSIGEGPGYRTTGTGVFGGHDGRWSTFGLGLTEADHGDDNSSVEQAVKGKLKDVVRICRVMIRDAERAAEESIRIESRLAGENGVSVATQRLQEVAEYCFEEFGVERESLTARVAMSCLKEAAERTRRHGAVCISVFESALLVLREYVCTARNIVKGRHSTTITASATFGGRAHRKASMSFVQAERLLQSFERSVLPICYDVENFADAVWCGKAPAFSKQVCRQIRTACAATDGLARAGWERT